MISVVSLTPTVYAASHSLSMPYRIIRPCIVDKVKPYELIAALMHREDLGALPFAKKIGKPKLQPQIHRFIKGGVKEPARTTAAPLAAYFHLPIDAIYDEKVATAEAKRLGISALPTQLAQSKPKAAGKAKTAPFDSDVMAFAALVQKLSPRERSKLKMLYQVARDGINPNIDPAPGRDDSTQPDRLLDSDSGLGELFDAKLTKPPAKGKP